MKSPDPTRLSHATIPVKATHPASSASKVTPSASYLRIEDVDLKEERTIYSHKALVNRVKELSDSEYISCSNDKTIKFWRTN